MILKVICLYVISISGDCCGSSDYSVCSECLCKYDEYEVLGLPTITDETEVQEDQDDSQNPCSLFSHLIGDGFCHDQANTAKCSYDGGDCCNPVTLINACQECVCRLKEMSVTIVHKIADCPKPWQLYLNNGHCDDIVRNRPYSQYLLYEKAPETPY